MLALAIASSAGVLGALALVLALEAVRLARRVRAGQDRIAREVELQTRVLAAAARLAAAPDPAPPGPNGDTPSGGDGSPVT
ncbi:hypothetical protein [Actinomadura logoneensis]|uniref:hypothetical protein n=1 Tax=Actinomadura logoneensis TaxID=2293572 RepID=UPI001313E9BF|nr:hypothetical protein [Actinomadura logoneensis]